MKHLDVARCVSVEPRAKKDEISVFSSRQPGRERPMTTPSGVWKALKEADHLAKVSCRYLRRFGHSKLGKMKVYSFYNFFAS